MIVRRYGFKHKQRPGRNGLAIPLPTHARASGVQLHAGVSATGSPQRPPQSNSGRWDRPWIDRPGGRLQTWVCQANRGHRIGVRGQVMQAATRRSDADARTSCDLHHHGTTHPTRIAQATPTARPAAAPAQGPTASTAGRRCPSWPRGDRSTERSQQIRVQLQQQIHSDTLPPTPGRSRSSSSSSRSGDPSPCLGSTGRASGSTTTPRAWRRRTGRSMRSNAASTRARRSTRWVRPSMRALRSA